MAEEIPWTRLADVWKTYRTRSFQGDDEHNATHLDPARLCLCALAHISLTLDEIKKALRHRELLDAQAIVPLAEELQERREKAQEMIERFVAAEERKRGPLEPRTRADWIGWLYDQNKGHIEVFDSHGYIHQKYSRLWGYAVESDVEVELEAALRVQMPHSWKKRSKRYKVFAAWMKRRINRKR